MFHLVIRRNLFIGIREDFEYKSHTNVTYDQ